MTDAEVLAFDRAHLWHPYASPVNPPPVFLAERSSGTQIVLPDGTELTDAVSSWWCAAHGHNHPHIVEAIHRQSRTLSHVMFGGFTHRPAVELTQRLIAMTPEGLDSVFLADSGSISVEVATKMAVQYQRATGHPGRCRMLALRGGYHGDTVGAMALSDPEGMHTLFAGLIPHHFFADQPSIAVDGTWNEAAFDSIRTLVEAHTGEIAALICEPVFQAANAMWFYHPMFLRRMRELCDEHGLLLIFDEIATGFGRTGRLFAWEYAGVEPDIMCIGKALTGGYMTMAAVLATNEVADMLSAQTPGVFMHGPTFMGNPLACAVACASIRLLTSREYDWQGKVFRIERQLKEELEPARALPQVSDVRVLGAIGVIELKQPVDMARMQRRFVDEGIWVRPFGRLVYVMPPYVIQPEELSKLTQGLIKVVKSI